MKSNPKKTLIIISIALIVLSYYFKNLFLVYPIPFLLFVAFFYQKLAFKIEKAWFKLALILGFISSKILLSIVYFIVLTPISLIFRLTNKKLSFKQSKQKNSNFININKKYEPKDLEKMW